MPRGWRIGGCGSQNRFNWAGEGLAGSCAGGDWGSIISATLAREYPQRCRAIHMNLVFAGPCWSRPLHWLQMANLLPGLRRFPVFLSRDEIQSVQDGRHFREHETGAFAVQASFLFSYCQTRCDLLA